MSKQIIEAISKAFNRGFGMGKDIGFYNPFFIKKALKEEIEDALLRILNAVPTPAAPDNEGVCECDGWPMKADYCKFCGKKKP